MENVSRGRWGERLAEELLVRKGWRVVGRNVRPCPKDRRCEIDLIVRSKDGSTVVFVEVKAHARRTEWDSRLSRIDGRKKRILRRACANWIMRNRWHGSFRFDVVEVWGTGTADTPPEIDHIENVPLFGPNWRFW